LVRAAQAGDREALDGLVRRYQRVLFVLCFGLLRNADDAEDAVQEAFLRALRALPRFRREASARTWLSRIAVNVCREWQRARRRRHEVAPLDRIDDLAEPLASACAELEAIQQLAVARALDDLPARQREIFLLHVWEGWTVLEIAASLRWAPWRVNGELKKCYRALDARRCRECEAE
jgi:RNA polymerase sigma-70 factor (ECF subfamily)